MHDASLRNMQRVYDRHVAPHLEAADSGILVVDVGSGDVNGSYRQIFESPVFDYVGVDLAPGPGVDIVSGDPYAYPLPDDHADLVISGQMMEHSAFFWRAFDEMVRIAKPGGLIVVIVPSTGPIHRYPVDCYRFLPDAMPALAAHAGCRLIDTWHDEVSEWGDVVGVFAKPGPNEAQVAAEQALQYGGTEYSTFIAEFLKARGTTAHLEIGTFNGQSLAPLDCTSLAIDPDFRLSVPVIGAKPAAFFFQMTSEAFFDRHDPTVYLGGPITSAFLDGMHRFEVLLADFIQTERHCAPSGVVFLHDCLPLTVEMTSRNQSDVPSEGAYPHWWTGDVWKLVPILRTYRPDLQLTFLDTPPTGLLMVTRLNPESRVLADAYERILEEYLGKGLDEKGLRDHIENCPLRSSGELLAEVRS